MQGNVEEMELAQRELSARLQLIESMIAEGRQTTERWGWTFVLWGIAYYVAIGWSTWGHSNYAWPVTMIAAGILTAFGASRKGGQPETTIGRAIGGIWMAAGVSLFLFGLSSGLSGHGEQHTVLAGIEAMLGAANAASGILLKWKMQFTCALVWWAAAVSTCFVTVGQSSIIFLVAIFLCQIAFGSYMAVSEARDPRFCAGKQGISHV